MTPPLLFAPSFRGDAKRRTTVRNCAPENLEIPGSPFGRPGMTVQVESARAPPAYFPAPVVKPLTI